MAEFKLSRFKYNWKGVWAPGTDYIRDDVVSYGGKVYVCLLEHTADSQNIYVDIEYTPPGYSQSTPRWVQMLDGYHWRGSWAPTTYYALNDIVFNGGIVYRCTTAHTSGSILAANQSNWIEYVNSTTLVGDWAIGITYSSGQVVLHGGNLYNCVVPHTSFGRFESTIGYWELIFENIEYRGQWINYQRYKINDLVNYGSNIWICTEAHDGGFSLSQWEIYIPGQKFIGQWNGTTSYVVNDLVRHGGNIYVSKTLNDGKSPGVYTSDWQQVFEAYIHRGTWSRVQSYGPGDTVRRGGNVYVALKDSIGIEPSDLTASDGSTLGTEHWTVLVPGNAWKDYWREGIDYGIDDVVTFEGNTYRCIVSNVSTDSNFPENGNFTFPHWELMIAGNDANGLSRRGDLVIRDTSTDNSTLRNNRLPIGTDREMLQVSPVVGAIGATIKRVVTMVEPIPPELLVKYSLDGEYHPPLEFVVGNTYVLESTTEDLNGHPILFSITPDGEWGGGIPYETNVVYKFDGDEVPFDVYVDVASRRAADKVSVSITITDETPNTLYYYCDYHPVEGNRIDIVNPGHSAWWKEWGILPKVYYVSESKGVDIPENGKSWEYPWKTIRYATENVIPPAIINVRAGKYEEILPIIVPAGVQVEGTELRTTTVAAAGPVEALADDPQYTTQVLNHIQDLIQDLVLNVAITPTVGNTQVQDRSLDAGDIAAAAEITFRIQDIIDYINYRVDESAANPTVFGTNNRTILDGRNRAYAILEANKEFLAEEATAWMQQSFPAYSFDAELCKRDMRRYVDAWKEDILYSRNYSSVLAARYYMNAVQGSGNEVMWYLRNATNLRNMTFTGVTGVLSPVVEDVQAGSFVIGQQYQITFLGSTDFTEIGATKNEIGILFEATGPGAGDGLARISVLEVTRRSVGGAFVSLDPGWGVNDERTWITTRSPYIQNCTTFGTECTGILIDGSIHNGGYKSMVANDFTQIINDGVGAWVSNKGRAELVSVFTYYNHIGYLTETGGIIRATNGNNSYGKFGAVADGVDPTTTILTGTVNDRIEHAVVNNAFAGESKDEILLFEFANAGNDYTTVNYDIVGAGVGCDVIGDEFRDNSIFQCRISDLGDSTSPGGGGYTVVGNNAQGGNTTSIILASNDRNVEADYLGMRIIISSGTGTGQYGVITSYDDYLQGASLVMTVAKESDGTPGWDHVIPGTPIKNPLDTTTYYRIEPRVEFSHPGYSATASALPGNLNWDNVIFGNTTETYNGVGATYGTGTTIDVPPDEATFNVVKAGVDYSVTINNIGAGYAIGDTITILGTDIGGETPANDLRITVNEVSDDSTNSITAFTFVGKGYNGKFLATAVGQNTGAWSKNGTTWAPFALPNGGAGATGWIMAANNSRFVAIRRGTNKAGYSLDGESWTSVTMPVSAEWSAVVYGNGKFLAISATGNYTAYSIDGTSWVLGSTGDMVPDSTIGDWESLVYGQRKFVALCKNTNVAAYSTDGITWTQTLVQADSTIGQWTGIAFGNNRFVAISEQQNAGAYSLDGITWTSVPLPTQDGSTAHSWADIKYGQGVFFIVGNTGSRNVFADPTTGPTRFCATSEDGINWTPRELTDNAIWTSVAFGNPGNNPMWIAVSGGSSLSSTANKIVTGARAKGRVTIASGKIGSVLLWETGSGYTTTPTITIIDPSNTSDSSFDVRVGNGVISQPTFVTRGTGYRTSTTVITITGDGYADIIPESKYLVVDNLLRYPKVGSNLLIDGKTTNYIIVTITEMGGVPGNYMARFQISPVLEIIDNIQHGTPITISEQFSQVRLTNHDFLDIGLGNLTDTNYPNTLYPNGTVLAPENEIVGVNGGRVFYTSSDQDGNFRVGELFNVEQASGVVTISADFFDLNGLSELQLGGVRLGGTGTVIREFSTDALFTADSNNIIPTQRAIKAYLQRRLTIGGSEVSTGTLTAGVTVVGPARIDTTTGIKVNIPVKWTVSGPFAGVGAGFVAQLMFYKSFTNDGQ